MTRRASNRSGTNCGLLTPAMLACLLAAKVDNACGQEALRISLASDVAAETSQRAENTLGYYNLLLGPLAWRFSSGLGLQYNDNVNLVQNNPEGDFIFTPNVNALMHWPVTDKNSLDFSMGFGYSAYVSHPDLDQLYINPGSGVAFNIYIRDWVINLHDQISISENTYQNPTSGGGNSSQLQNTMGATATWDLNKALVTFGYDHVNYVSIGSSQQQQPDGTSENLFANAGMRVHPAVLIGLEAGGGLVSYDQSGAAATTPDASQWNTGVFGSAQISDYMSARLDAGYTVYSPDTSAANPTVSEQSGLYFQFSLSHRVNKFMSYLLSAGRSTDFSFSGQPESYYFVRLQPDWKLFRKYQLSTPIFWQKGTEVYNQAADYDQYGLGVNISRPITKKLSGALTYQFVKESSGQAGLNYMVNIVGLNFSYQF